MSVSVARRLSAWLLVALLAASVGLVVYLGVRPDPPASALLFQPEQVSRITMRVSDSDLILQRRQAHWYISAPLMHVAQQDRVALLLSLSGLDPANAQPVADLDLRELGLIQPVARIEMDSGSDTVALELGGLGAYGEKRYLKIGSWVWLGRDVLWPLIRGGLNAFANLSLLLPEDGQLVAIERGASPLAASYLDAWRSMQAASIVPLAHWQLRLKDRTANQVALHFADGRVARWQFLADGQYVYLLPEGADGVFLLTQEQAVELGLIRV